MILNCVSFGSLWWLRPGNDSEDSQRYVRRAAIFNTTGFIQGSQTHRHWTVAGVVRINAGMHREAREAAAFTGRQYLSFGLEQRGSWNRVLLGLESKDRQSPEAILVCTHSDRVGRINFQKEWHSKGVDVVAASALRGVQEVLLLMRCGSTIQTEKGVWEATWDSLKQC